MKHIYMSDRCIATPENPDSLLSNFNRASPSASTWPPCWCHRPAARGTHARCCWRDSSAGRPCRRGASQPAAATGVLYYFYYSSIASVDRLCCSPTLASAYLLLPVTEYSAFQPLPRSTRMPRTPVIRRSYAPRSRMTHISFTFGIIVRVSDNYCAPAALSAPSVYLFSVSLSVGKNGICTHLASTAKNV